MRISQPRTTSLICPAPNAAVRAHLPAPWQDILDLAYYSGWRKNKILGLTWEEIDEASGVIQLSPARSKTLVGRILPESPSMFWSVGGCAILTFCKIPDGSARRRVAGRCTTRGRRRRVKQRHDLVLEYLRRHGARPDFQASNSICRSRCRVAT